VEQRVARRIPELSKAATHRWGGFRWPADAIPPIGVRPESVSYASDDSGEIRHMLVFLAGRTIGTGHIGAVYPFVPHGIAHEVEIRALHPADTGIEGEVSVAFGGTELRYFEPLWGIRRQRYRPGKIQRVRFAAFGHRLAASAGTGELSEVPSALVMIGPGGSSRYGMHAPIVEWRGFWVEDRLYYALKMRLVEASAQDDGEDFAINLYAGRHCFNGAFTPAPGIALSGVIWLHGTLSD
jgi:hypothetical protein